MSCCNNLKGNCNQGRDCPVRRANSFPLATGASLKAPPKPLPPVEPDSDTADRALHLVQWLALTAFVVLLAVAAGVVFQG